MSGYGFTQSGTVYDDEDRLTGFARANSSLTQSWSLTSVGDWNSVTTSGIGFQPVVQNRTHGSTHELLTAGGQTVNTDVKGNITLLPAVLSSLPSTASSLTWDFDNKLKSVDVGNNSSTDVEYKYDALGRRVARVGSSGSFVYVQSDQQTIADYGVGDAPSSPLYRYVYASYIDEPVVRKGAGTGGTIHYYHRNQQYSITAVTTSAGAIAERYAYSAYGEPTILDGSGSVLANSAINNRYTYTGREWDGTVGLYHFRARWMSPKTRRFLGRDPIGYYSSMNLYLVPAGLSDMDPSGYMKYIDPAGVHCDSSSTCKLFVCAYSGDSHPVASWITTGSMGTVGHASLCWNCEKNYPGGDELVPDIEPFREARPLKKGCIGLWPNGLTLGLEKIVAELEYMKDKCTHCTKPQDVCPETLMKANNAVMNPELSKCDWVLVPNTELSAEANCISWACRVYREAGINFPIFYDPYMFCHSKNPKITPIDRPKR